jgi:hypothetical protein
LEGKIALGEISRMTRVRVEPGICGLSAIVDAQRTGQKEVQITIQSDCEKVTALGSHLDKMSLADILSKPLNQSTVYEKAGRCELHGSCPIPCAVMKAAEAELQLALKKVVKIAFDEDS